MRRLLPMLLAGCAAHAPMEVTKSDRATVTIARDEWGIAHVHGKTDADAVFGMLYAQAEDDFPRIESNYLTALGRVAEAEGEDALVRDLRARLFVDPAKLPALYARCPAWLRALMDAFADGLNTYLRDHPAVKPRVLRRFEPWMALAFSEGSIGGDIERISEADLGALYGTRARASSPFEPEPSGSNGIAIGGSRSTTGAPLLLINPHTSFYFRGELQVTSDEGLDVYGAVTWGQFFVYQGFNRHMAWMHTSSGVDVVDEFAETLEGDRYVYGAERRPVETETIALAYRKADGQLGTRRFVVRRTHHGPIVREDQGRPVSVALMNRPVEALAQSFLRTKAKDVAAFRAVSERKANSSNNTVLADASGTIAYLHPQFIPRRDDRFDFTKPVDGKDPRADWHGLHALDEAPHVIAPRVGYIHNTNDWPYSAAGPESPRREAFPRYMDVAGPNPRGVHAQRLLERAPPKLSREDLVRLAFDRDLPAFDELLPPLLAAQAAHPRPELAEPIATLAAWDRRWAVDSAATSLAVYWGEELFRPRAPRYGAHGYEVTKTPEEQLDALAAAAARLTADFGSARVPWGEINRFQRQTPFRDDAPSLPVGFTSAIWGSLAAYGAPPAPGAKRRYGTFGNSFVAVVELGTPVRALAIKAGGQSGDPASPHYLDQAERFTTGELREVHVTPDDVARHTVTTERLAR